MSTAARLKLKEMDGIAITGVAPSQGQRVPGKLLKPEQLYPEVLCSPERHNTP